MATTERLAALKAGDSIDFWREDEPVCPHCGQKNEVAENELYHLYEEGEHTIECLHCEIDFMVYTNVKFSFCTDQQPEQDSEEA